MPTIEDIVIIELGEQGPAGAGVPIGGTTGQYLRKKTDGNFDTEWSTSSATVPGLDDIGDVVITTPTDGQSLVYDSATGNWVNETVASSGGGTWGSITGTLSDQTDLQAALNGKSSTGHNHNDLYFTESEVTTLLSGKSDTTHDHTGTYEPANVNIQSHIGSTSNPHSVTKTQVGLGNVDNTSDANKPVSTATQTALNGKSDTTHNHTGVYLTSETDPVFTAWDKSTGISITESQISDLGDYAASTHNHAFVNLTDVPSITGNAGKLFKVNATADGFIWGDPAGASIAWGDITGTLASQTDLQTALNGKSATTHNHTGVYLESETDPVFTAWDKSTGISITESQISDLGTYETAFTKNTAFNKDFGTTVGTVCQGNDSRLSDSRAPTAHTHVEADITDLGTYLTTETDPVFTAWDKSTGISITESQISDHGTYEPANVNIQSHISSTSNPHSVTAAQVGTYTSGDIDTLLGGKSSTSHNHPPVVSSPTYSSSMTVDVSSLVDVVRVTLTGNPTINFTGGTDGQRFVVELTQDATGSRTVTWGAAVRFGTDITSVTLTTTASKTDRVGFVYNSGAGKYDVVAYVRGF